ncbi:MAG: sigma-70 family RNA polymerase sigma factor [Isosphaera sp.]|nr:sigma-70 family RNA polymerase sigma factor [Isosphaera sp.]
MSDPVPDTAAIQACLDRWRAGDPSAADDLIRQALTRLTRLARGMLRSFPNVRASADTDDVLQSSLIRLLRTLRTLRPDTPRTFFNLAAVQVRRELLDLARKARVRRTVPLDPSDSDDRGVPEPAAPDGGPDAETWVRFHEAVEQLPVEEREVVGLAFYHDWTQERIAELFGVDERTVRRWWSSAKQRLRETAGDVFDE